MSLAQESGSAKASAEGDCNGPQLLKLKVEEDKECEKSEPVPQETLIKEEPKPEATLQSSATIKALNKINYPATVKKKNRKLTTEKKKRLNEELSKILTPKNALALLQELKPGCTYTMEEDPCKNPTVFVACVKFRDKVLGTGSGTSKNLAKSIAAENAIKTIVSEAYSSGPKQENSAEMELDKEDAPENLPWAALASFAMYKMFSEWQIQGAQFPFLGCTSINTKLQAQVKGKSTSKAELPENAVNLHPSAVLNLMRPGLVAVELDRGITNGQCRVTMGFEIDGKLYTGIGGNKKEAKREAARAVLSELYGLVYPS